MQRVTWLDEVPLDTPSCALGLGVWHGAGGERACCEGVSNSHDGSNVSLFCSASAQRGRGLVAVVYVSEGKSQGVVDALETVARDVCATHGAQVVNVFRDVEYNRTGFTLGARVPPPPPSTTPTPPRSSPCEASPWRSPSAPGPSWISGRTQPRTPAIGVGTT